MPVGPNGEKRPQSSVASIVKTLRVATGIDEEEYVDSKEAKANEGEQNCKDRESEL